MIRTLTWILAFAVLAGGLVAGSCSRPGFKTGLSTEPADDLIVICGEKVHIGARVIRWDEPSGFNGYLEHCWGNRTRLLPANPANECDTVKRFGVRPCLLKDDGEPLPLSPDAVHDVILRNVDLIVLHYDAAGSSRRCFEILHDERGLSAHFLIDANGSIYQTLDVRERARHAGPSNDRSVGIEIANVGAYADHEKLTEAYNRLHAASSAPKPVTGYIQGKRLHQFPFTDAQYDSLARLTGALCRALPNLQPVFPTSADGGVFDRILTLRSMRGFTGILGHHHVASHKLDPGPAFDWKRFDRALQDVLQE